ncbi:MAG: hypothetical protein ABR587_03365 [Candidatus Binatia bacterium]
MTSARHGGLHPQKKLMAAINLLGGPAVLGSYAWGASAYSSETVQRLWGDVPLAVRPYYTSWMFVAATGYLLFLYYLFVRVDAERARVAGGYGFGLFNVLLVLILVPSAMWMPLTLHHIEAPDPLKWKLIVAGLWTTGLASLAMIGALSTLVPRESATAWKAALVGSVLFAGQTFLLDAVVWTVYFRV